MSVPKITVIIAMYNMAEWVGYAIETVENQTMKDIELICVDDGSTDDTMERLLSYQKHYPDLIILHQENKGAGPARNLGIVNAHGKYIAFLDADDYYYSDDALEYLYTKAEENNALICRGSSCDNRDGVISYKGLRTERTFTEEKFIDKKDFPGPTGYWAGIYNRDFLVKNELSFPDLRRGQDGVFSTKAIAIAGKVYCVPKTIYVYRKEHKTVKYTEDKAVDNIKAIYEIIRIASENGLECILSAWKREIFGEPAAMLYKYAAAGNKEMLLMVKKLNGVIGGGLLEGNEIKSYVTKVQREKDTLLCQLRQKDAVYIFGAGTIAKKVIAYLIKNGITPSAIIVSDTSQNPEQIDGIKVKPISSIQLDQEYEVIISTFWYIQESIKETLGKNGVMNVILLDLCDFYLWQNEIIR